MAKEIKAKIKLQVAAGQAKPTPPVGPVLGQQGVNIMEFCKAFNAQTSNIAAGTPMRVEITVYKDKSFTFILKGSPTSFLIKQAAGLTKGAKATKRDAIIGDIKMSVCKEIAKKAIEYLNTSDIDRAALMIKGTAESMGLNVIADDITIDS